MNFNTIIQTLHTYKFLLFFFLFYFIISGLPRLYFALNHSEIYPEIFLLGLRMDLMIISLLSFIPVILHCFNFFIATRIYLAFIFPFIILLEIFNFHFFEYFNIRLDYLFAENIIFFEQIAPMITEDYLPSLLLSIILIPLISFYIFKFSKKLFSPAPVKTKILILPLILIVLLISTRGSLRQSAPNPSYFSWSTENIDNEITNNTIYALLSSVYYHNNTDLEQYGKPKNKSFEIFNKLIESKYSRKKNIILIILESFGSHVVGSLGGKCTSPEFDRISEKGFFLSNMYSSSNRTNRGIEAVLSSTYPYIGNTYLKSLDAAREFWTIADTLKEENYATTFIYGGDSKFDNMKTFLLSNGYGKIYDSSNLNIKKDKYSWGYPDEEIYNKAIDQLKKSSSPEFITLLTVSSHEPFDYPQGRTPLLDDYPVRSFENAVRYADWALGKFIKELEELNFFDDSLLVIVADHNAKLRMHHDNPIEHHRIPALFISHDLPKENIKTVTHQADIAPTLFNASGISTSIPAQGNDLLTNKKSRALFLSQGSYVYLKDDGHAIFQSNKPPSGNKKLFDEGLSLIYNSYYAHNKKSKH